MTLQLDARRKGLKLETVTKSNTQGGGASRRGPSIFELIE